MLDTSVHEQERLKRTDEERLHVCGHQKARGRVDSMLPHGSESYPSQTFLESHTNQGRRHYVRILTYLKKR